MPAWIPAAISAAASLFGGHKANQANVQEAAKNRAFQERMSSTSWQRGVQDMRAAGLNPALAYGMGGASSPSGSMASQSDIVTPAVNSAMAGLRLKKELRLLDEQAEKVYNDSLLARNSALESAARRERVYLEQDQIRLNNRLLELQLPWATSEAAAAAKYGKYASPLSLFMRSGGGAIVGGLSGGLGGFLGSRLGKSSKPSGRKPVTPPRNYRRP